MSLISLPCLTSKPPSINSSPISFLSYTATPTSGVNHRPPSKPHTSSKLLHTTRAAHTSSALCLGRFAISPLSYINPYIDTAPPRPQPGPPLSDSSGRSPIVLYNFSVAPQDCHTQKKTSTFCGPPPILSSRLL